MLKIRFRYKDEYTRGDWSYQECICNSVKECIEWYGLKFCEKYEILEFFEV